MPVEIDRPKPDYAHQIRIKNTKIERKKKLQEENDTIDRNLRSPAFTEKEKERDFQQRERNRKEIIKLRDDIKEIDNDLLPPSGSYPGTRGRSNTRGPNRRYASPSPIRRSPRSASRLYAESSRYGDDIYHFNSKIKDMDSEVSYRLRLQNADLSIQHQNISKENKDLRDINYKLNLDSEILSREIKRLEAEKEFIATMLQDKNTKITKYKLAVVELEYDNDLIRDEMDRFTIEKKSMYGQIEELSRSLSEERQKVKEIATKRREKYEEAILDLQQKITSLTEELREKETTLTTLVKVDIPLLWQERDEYKESAAAIKLQLDENKERLRQLEVNYKSETDVLRSNQSDLENRVQHLHAENERLQRNGETERKGAEDLRRVLYSEKRNSDELRDRNKHLERSCQRMLKFEELLQEYIVENERLQRENAKTLNYQNIAGKTEHNNAILRGRLKIETEEKARLQRENNTLKTQIDSAMRENEWSRKNNLEELGNLQSKNDGLKEDLELMQKAYQRERINVTTLQQKENEMKQKIHEIIERNRNLENEKQKEKASFSTKRDHEKEISRLHSVLKDKDLEEDRLRNKIEELEKKNNEIQSRTDKRLRQLEDNYEIEQETLKSNHTDLEKKVKQLQDEKERLLQNGESDRQIADKLKCELDAEKRDSKKLRERMRDLERESIEKIETERKQVLDEKDRELIRLRRSENDYKNEADTLKHELADLRRDFSLLQEEKDELIESGKKEMKKAKDLQKELDDARREKVKFRDRIKELERHMMTVPKVDPSVSAENSRLKEDLKHLGIELKNAQERLRQLEISNKIETASLNSKQIALEKNVKKLQDEKERLLRNEEMKRKVAEKMKSDLGDRDPERGRFQTTEEFGTERKQVSGEKEKELIRLRRLENVYKNETDSLKHELTDLKEKNELLEEEKEKLVESEETERKIAENVQTELDDAKRESLMLRDRIEELERQMTSPKVDPSLSEENSRLKEDLKHLGIELQKAQQKITGNEESVRHYMRQVETLQREKQQAIAEKESALTRLSALAGDRLRDNNAAIADLSDENRPINLGEKFSELYDNQWTDAIEKLEKLMTERDAIQKLLSMIQKIYCACKNIAKEQLDLIAKAFGLEGRKEKLKRLKDFRKSMAPDNLQDIKEMVNSSCVTKDFSQEAAYCASYINRSVELCWYMCIQDPPVVLEFKASHGDVFNDKIYRHFTKSGRTIDYMVWPVMYLHSNGPLLQKGVVQPV